MGSAFPQLLGCFVGRVTETDTDDLGMIVGWSDGYLVYVTDGGRLDSVAWDDRTIAITGRGRFLEPDEDDEKVSPAKRVAAA